MKSRILAIIILGMILVICFWGTYSMLQTDGNNEEAVLSNNNQTNTLRSQVYSDYLENSVVMDGVVLNKREEESYSLSSEVGKYENVKMNCKLHDTVEKDDVIFTIGAKEYKSEVNGIVMEILQEDEYVSVNILDYDMLYIAAKLDYVYEEKIFIGKKIWVSETNPLASKNKHKETVENIGCEVQDNMIDVILSNDVHYLPGTALKLEFTYKEKIKSCYVLKQMVLEDATDRYVYVEVNGERVKRVVETGKEFIIASDGVETEYVEISSGVSEGEGLVVDVVE